MNDQAFQGMACIRWVPNSVVEFSSMRISLDLEATRMVLKAAGRPATGGRR